MDTVTTNGCIRARVRVRGTVQGVGFRPFVHRLAHEHGLAGYVCNDQHGVLLEIEGEAAAVERFSARLVLEAPPLSVIEAVVREPVAVVGERGFRIAESVAGGRPDAPVTPDSTVCDDCLAELFDPTDRRHRYPFVNCTNCGPRFTIIRGVPYDRPRTTMSAFRMCADCAREYHDPDDRRFHAQPNACPTCGPRVWLEGVRAQDPIAELARRLRAGAIAAVKGIGGFHLACDAASEEAVGALRTRKRREQKPFALMVSNVESARELVELDDGSEQLLRSGARPIVLSARRRDAPVAHAVAPGAGELGVMLPYTPLHHLLLADFGGALVMTSGNVSDEPIAFEDPDALRRLAPIADVFLLHDRQIHARTDDSVARRGAIIRRSRGYVPHPLALPCGASRPLLACGAEQKNTFCVARDGHAWVSHHIGDLEHWAALSAFRDGVSHFERLFAVVPEIVAHDLHPGYLSTAFALDREDVQLVGVQHHHAHLAACLAEHGITSRAVGAIFDGTGYGTDGTVWGGELLVGDLRSFERAGWLHPVRLPGGAAAIREPWRMAFAWLAEALGDAPAIPERLGGLVRPADWRAIDGIHASDAVSPVTSSIGRLFDAVAALCGLRARVSYEGQAAVELEWAASRSTDAGSYQLELTTRDDAVVLDPRGAIRALARDLDAATCTGTVAARFHRAVADATARACALIASERGLDTVVLSGGVFQNRLLLGAVTQRLEHRGLRVLVPRLLPANDGGISYGQAAVAAARSSMPGI